MQGYGFVPLSRWEYGFVAPEPILAPMGWWSYGELPENLHRHGRWVALFAMERLIPCQRHPHHPSLLARQECQKRIAQQDFFHIWAYCELQPDGLWHELHRGLVIPPGYYQPHGI